MKRLSEMQIMFIDNASKLRLMMNDLTRQSRGRDWHLNVDFEGVDLSRDGEICTGQFMGKGSRRVYVVDFVAMNPFDVNPRLKNMLQSPSVLKLLFDPRNDADALGSLHGVHLRNVLCLQLADRATRRCQGLNRKYECVRSLKDVLADDDLNVIHESDRKEVMSIKRVNFGRGEGFKQRNPDGTMGEKLLKYCAIDVYYFDELKVALYDSCPSSKFKVNVDQYSAERILEWTNDGYQTHGWSKSIAPF